MKADKLKNITLKITDGKHGDCRNQDDSGYYFISCKDIYDEFIHYENARQITKDDFIETDRRTNLAANDILITNSGTIGRMAYVKDLPETRKTTFQKSVAIIKADNNIVNPQYLFYLLKSKVGDFVNSSNGSAQKNLLLSTMRDFEIVYSENKTIQHRIAAILSRYDTLIENYRKQIKLLEEAAQCLYKEWFVDFRFPGHENVKIMDGVPEGWEKKRLSEIGNVITGKTPPTSHTEYYGGTIPFITIPNMKGVFPESTQYLTYIGANTQAKKFIPKDSIMVSCIGTAGLVCITKEMCQTNQQINSLILNDARLLGYMYFTLCGFKEHLNNIGSNGATMTNVNKSKFESIEIMMPTTRLYKDFNDFCSTIFETIKSLSTQIRLLSEARDLLLPKLMSGEMKV